jgi:hypothetical protein
MSSQNGTFAPSTVWPFRYRDAELDALHKLFEQYKAGKTQFCVVRSAPTVQEVGGRGNGKSRLLLEFSRAAAATTRNLRLISLLDLRRNLAVDAKPLHQRLAEAFAKTEENTHSIWYYLSFLWCIIARAFIALLPLGLFVTALVTDLLRAKQYQWE